VHDLIQAGRIGEPRMISADFGFRSEIDPASRLFDRQLAGGGLLDVGVYTIALATMLFGAQPRHISGCAHLGSTGVDEQAAYTLGWNNGAVALLSCGIRTTTPHIARIDGTTGSITIPQFWRATKAIITDADGSSQTLDGPHERNGFEYQIRHVAECIGAGLTSSPLMPTEESLGIQRIMATLRQQWGLRYPGE
jgi:dihydrodiol dehydrogenase / D-xylose 1-dehydrogenase (NADP)